MIPCVRAFGKAKKYILRQVFVKRTTSKFVLETQNVF